MTIFWELLRYEETKEGRFYRIVDTAETVDFDPHVPKFKEECHGDIILGHKSSGGLEAYRVDDIEEADTC